MARFSEAASSPGGAGSRAECCDGAVAFLALVVYVPGLRGLFHFAPMHPVDLAIALAAGIVGVAWFELVKLFMRRPRPA